METVEIQENQLIRHRMRDYLKARKDEFVPKSDLAAEFGYATDVDPDLSIRWHLRLLRSTLTDRSDVLTVHYHEE